MTLLATTVIGVFAAQSPAEARRLHHRTSHSVAVHKVSHASRHHARRVSRKVRGAQVAAAQAATGQWMTNDGRYYQGAPSTNGLFSGGGSSLVAEARRWLGTNPTDRRSLWCARFMNFVLRRTGHQGTGSDMARSFASYGHRVSGPQVGAIAVISRKGGGHVGVVSGVDKSGNPIIISGNHGHRVAEAVYPRGRVYAYVMPSS
ncbi:MAG TPA: TIGR02594 family protein [Xanthobacteraceae bacterium]|jgi:uncharacterized protein (TIGR02594 family)|nr:TIGR02594 family protein [Xanthobacteraceae bacterium]